MNKIFKPIISLFEKLSSKPKVGGLQITDTALQYVLIKDGGVENFSLRLPPGILKQGKLMNPEQFSSFLKNLHDLIQPQKQKVPIRVIVTLPAEVVYTQSFSVPNINEEKLEESTLLNLQMISPIAPPQAYLSSQIIEESQDRYELLGAFAEKNLIDQYRTLLGGVGFEAVIFEFPAMALARVVSQTVGLAKEPILVLQISSDGLDIFLFRDESLHFDYFRSWQSIQGEARAISKSVFEEVVVEEVQRVINFALSRFKETPKQALLIMPGLEAEIKNILESRFSLKAAPLVLKSYALGPAWYAALGSAMRGTLKPKDDRFIALGVAEGVLNVFYEERILNFIQLWRNILIGVLSLFLVVFVISAAYLVGQTKTLKAQLANISLQTSSNELQDLENKAQEFNNLVRAVGQARGNPSPWLIFLKLLTDLAQANQVALDQFSMSSLGAPITLNARAPDHDAVVKFKNVLAAQAGFSNVNLPLADINTLPDNSVSFNITFQYTPSQ